jgi:hypothetical protein
MEGIQAYNLRLARLLLHGLIVIALCMPAGLSMAQQPGTIPAFLPYVANVPASQPMAIDGIWTVSSIGKRIRIEAGRAYAVDGWLHLFVLSVEPDMVVIQNIKPDGYGGYVGDDLPLMGKWQAKRAADGALDVLVAGAMGPVAYRLLPVSLDDPYRADDTYRSEPVIEEPPANNPPARPPVKPPGKPPADQDGKLASLGRHCYEDFKPMVGSMLKYAQCQSGGGRINALKQAMKTKDVEGLQEIIETGACRPELDELISTISKKGFKSFSLGVSGEFGAIVSGSTQLFVAMNLDLTNTNLYAAVGGSVGTQIGGSANGAVSAYFNPADRLSGGGKSFSVALKAMGGVGGEVGISNGRSPRCESFTVTGGAGAEVDAGSVGVSQTFKVASIPILHKPDFTPSCKDVTLKAVNNTGKEIKIIDLDFYDYVNKRWRSKVTKNERIANKKSWVKKFRLQKIGGDKTRVRFQYRVRLKDKGLKQWSKTINHKTAKLTCRDGMTISTRLTED